MSGRYDIFSRKSFSETSCTYEVFGMADTEHDIAAKFLDFFVWNIGRIFITDKVELDLSAVDMAVVIHDYRFYAATVHLPII